MLLVGVEYGYLGLIWVCLWGIMARVFCKFLFVLFGFTFDLR